MDLGDSVLMKGLMSVAPDLTLVTAPGWMRETLLSFNELLTGSEETVTRLPGVYGPGCRQHVGITNEDWYDGATVKDSSGEPRTVREALERWLEGEDVSIIDTVPPSLSDCKMTNDARD